VWFAKLLLRGLLPVGCFALLAWLSMGRPGPGPSLRSVARCSFACTPGSRRRWPHGSTLRRAVEFPKAGGAWGEILRQLADKLADETRGREEVEARLLSFRGAMDAVPDGLVILDADHRIQWSNRAASAHLGIRLPRDSGVIIEHLVRTPGFAEYLASPDVHSPFALQTPAVRTRIYTIRVVPLGDANKLLVSLDVTDARRVESMRSTFVANVSHELRTP
jgi:two-component system phosphate regulon sensor histidine kinase PhoR